MPPINNPNFSLHTFFYRYNKIIRREPTVHKLTAGEAMELQFRLLWGPCMLINKEQIPTSYPIQHKCEHFLVFQAGADPQCMDSRRNTPLHIIVTYQVLYLLLSSYHICGINVLKISFS
jgi:hypothetical protein